MDIIVLDQGPLARAIVPALAAAGLADRLVLVGVSPEAAWSGPGPAPRRRYGDPADPPSLPAALCGGTTLCMAGAAHGQMTGAALANLTEAARASGVERLVLISSIDPRPGNPAVWAATNREAEAMVRGSGLGWTVLRLQESLDDLVAAARMQQPTGRLVSNRATGRSAPIALADAAAATAAVLGDPGHAGHSYQLTGPELVASADLAAALGLTDIAYKDARYLEVLLAAGVAPAQADAAIALGRAVREGYYAVVSSDVPQLTGRSPLGLAGAVAAAEA